MNEELDNSIDKLQDLVGHRTSTSIQMELFPANTFPIYHHDGIALVLQICRRLLEDGRFTVIPDVLLRKDTFLSWINELLLIVRAENDFGIRVMMSDDSIPILRTQLLSEGAVFNPACIQLLGHVLVDNLNPRTRLLADAMAKVITSIPRST